MLDDVIIFKQAIADQGSCGSCWSFSTSGVLAQRMCIATDYETSTLVLAPQSMVSCYEQCSGNYCNDGCSGGYTSVAFAAMIDEGVAPEACVPYSSSGGSDPETCGTSSESGTVMDVWENCKLEGNSDTHFYASQSYSINSEEEIMRDIYENGPVQSTFLMESELYGYANDKKHCPAGI